MFVPVFTVQHLPPPACALASIQQVSMLTLPLKWSFTIYSMSFLCKDAKFSSSQTAGLSYSIWCLIR